MSPQITKMSVCISTIGSVTLLFASLDNKFTDVTLGWEDGQWVEAHKDILAGGSPKTSTPTLIFLLNGSYTDIQKTIAKIGKQVLFLAAQNWYLGWDNWRRVQSRHVCVLLILSWLAEWDLRNQHGKEVMTSWDLKVIHKCDILIKLLAKCQFDF